VPVALQTQSVFQQLEPTVHIPQQLLPSVSDPTNNVGANLSSQQHFSTFAPSQHVTGLFDSPFRPFHSLIFRPHPH
uniref:Ovule protein n=1 Tax=Mesocestoides corti TaxID=53468 RepID=A0A5K3G3L0_MESCO